MGEPGDTNNLEQPQDPYAPEITALSSSPARETLLFEYSCALDTGDFEAVGTLLEKAYTDPTLVTALLEIEELLEQEQAGDELSKEKSQAALAAVQAAMPRPAASPNPNNPQANSSGRATVTAAPITAVEPPESFIIPEFGDTSLPKAKFSQRHRNRLSLALVAGLVIALVASASLLLWSIGRGNAPTLTTTTAGQAGTTQVSASPIIKNSRTAPPGPTLNKDGLTAPDYPNSTKLTWNETTAFPNGRPAQYRNQNISAFATPDNYETVASFYQKQLETLGLKPTNNPEGCGSSRCAPSKRVDAQKDGQQIVVIARSPQVWQGQDEVSPEAFTAPLTQQLKPDQTFILVLSGPVYPPPTTPDSAPSLTPTQTTINVTTPAPANSNQPLYLGPDNAFHQDDSTSRVSRTTSPLVATSQPTITFKLLWLVSDAKETHLLGRFYVKGKVNEDMLRPSNPFEIGTIVDDQGQEYRLKTLDGGQGRTNNTSSMFFYLNLVGPPLKPGVHQVTYKPGPSLPMSFASPPSLDLQTYKEAGLKQGLIFNQAATFSSQSVTRTLKAWAGYFGPDHTLLNVGLSADGYHNNPPPTDGNDYTSDNAVLLRVGENVTVTTDQGIELRSAELPLGEYMPYAALFLEPLPPGTKSLTVKLTSSSTATMVTTPDPPNQAPIKVPLADLLKNGPASSGPELDLDGFKVKILREEATLDQATGKVSLKLRYQLPTTPDASGKTMQALYFACVKCSPDGNSSGAGGGDTGTPGLKEFTLNFNFSPDYSMVELRFDNVSYNLPGQGSITLPLPGAAAVAANNPAAKPPAPLVSSKKLGTTLEKVSLGMNEGDVVKALGAPKSRRIIVPGKSLVWQYVGLDVCGPVVTCVDTSNFQTAVTAEGFKLGQDQATFRQVYADYTINDTPDPYRLLIKDSAGTVLTAYFDETGQAYRLTLLQD